MFDNVKVEEGVDLPHLPDSIDPAEIGWQTKSFERTLSVFKLTEDGRLLRKEQSYRDKTAEEKQSEAEKWGYGSWDAYVQAYDSAEGLYPDSIDYDMYSDELGETPPSITPRPKTLDETFWADHNYHGTMEFYSSLRRNPVAHEVLTDDDGEEFERPTEFELDVFVSYEARFTKGELDDIVLVARHDYEREEIIEQLEEYDSS